MSTAFYSFTAEDIKGQEISMDAFKGKTVLVVNGDNAHPLYQYLKKELSGLFGGKIKWNFTKFLIDGNGKPVKRFSPYYKPEDIDRYVAELVN